VPAASVIFPGSSRHLSSKVLTTDQNQYTCHDAQYSQTHRDCGRNFDVEQGQQPGENQPETKQEHSQISSCHTIC